MSIYLNKFNRLSIDDIMIKPNISPKCHGCEVQTAKYRIVDDNLTCCYDCYDDLHHCNYCNKRSFNLEHGICKNCLHNSAYVLPYSEKPIPIFHRIKPHRISRPPLMTESSFSTLTRTSTFYPMHFGIELETDIQKDSDYNPKYTGNKLASLVNIIGKGSTTTEQLLYCKSDCTCFVEVVSHPFSWNYYLEYGQKIFQTLFKILRENELFGYDTRDCGFHVHISRKAIKPINLFKIASLVYHPDNYSFMATISQRSESKINEWCSLDVDFGALSKMCNDSYYASEIMDRSSAINLTLKKTVEFRIFRGTLNFNSFAKNLEFIKSLIHWSNVTSVKVSKDNNGLESYLNFLRKHYNDYETLCFFLSKRGYKGFKTVQDRWTRKHMTELNKLSFNSDSKELI